MKNLYIDFDGVILDTITVTYELLDEAGIDPKDIPSTREFYSNVDWPKLLMDTPEINDSMECLQRVIDSNLFHVYILTHVNSLPEAAAKINFIRKTFSHITIIPVPKNISKAKIVDAKDSILIDDFAGNLREWESNGGIGVRFSTNMNGKGFHVIDHLDQVIELFSQN